MDENNSIIIIDDDIDLLNMIEEGLLSQGYRCETAINATSALELIKKTSFDIMITDIVLNGMDGFELTEKANKLRPDMLVIIMTGYTEDFSYDRAIEVGASDFIKKPFTLQELIIRVQLVKLKEKLIKMSVTDELTSLNNRRGFFTLAEQQLKQANREKNKIYLLYADLDNLKSINDELGHQGGDQALIETANLLRDTFRDSDIIARIGGDEFVVIPIGTADDGVNLAVSRFSQNLVKQNAKGERNYKLSISIGLACYDPEAPNSIDELLSKADKSMYEEKRKKKNS
ncbi:MAG: GGDEF domain-containing protein [Planctomycetota bacterium]|jgi:diguanylate cyclase (GGDEF)-like protein